jgi:hypothetical protein
MRKKLIQEIDRLQNLYYLIQYLGDEGRKYLRELYAGALAIPRSRIPEAMRSLQAEMETVKSRAGCRLTNSQINSLVKKLTTAGDGYLYISKRFIDRHWFQNYEEVFPRWPHIPGHALVVFDADINRNSPYSLFVPEEQIFGDAKLLLKEIQQIVNDGKTFRTREKAKQKTLFSYLRTLATVVYHFLEAYLNGIAFNCFQDHHNLLTIEDHDLLAEWDSVNKRPRFIPFETKLKKYPVICGKYLGQKVSIQADSVLEFLLTEGKALRDCLTHPSPYINRESDDPSKLARLLTINADQVRRLLDCAVTYVRRVEESLGHDVNRSVPWLKLD